MTAEGEEILLIEEKGVLLGIGIENIKNHKRVIPEVGAGVYLIIINIDQEIIEGRIERGVYQDQGT